jgi:Cdc6-like AAA superfamily ATPase
MKQYVSPFKLLDPYTIEDKDIFFGRDQEVDALYKMVFQTNLILVYGQSGTGKTSIIKCGLANRFKKTDWFDLYVRRQENINDSLRNAIRSNVKTSIRDDMSLSKMIHSIFLDYFKPVYIIFDQFEELFILGSEEEKKQFIHDIAELLQQEDLPCTLVIVMREEYIAQLYDFEKVVPELFDKRIRIEPMSRANASHVIQQTCDKFGIELEEETAETIVDKITEERGRVQLTYLQVFLDKLHRNAFEINPEKIVFDRALVEKLGRIDDVLVDFLEEQLLAYERKMGNRNTALSFLKIFVSPKGTKVPVMHRDISNLLPGFTKEELNQSLEFFVSRRILRPLENEQYELTHDSLAAKIATFDIQIYKMPEAEKLAKYSSPENPYVGYQYYTQEMAALFFGRDKEIMTLFNKIANQPQSRISVIYGQLGVGKTSLILAGLLPRLSEYFNCHYIRCNKKLIENAAIEKLLENNPEELKNLNLYTALFGEEKQNEKQEIIIFDQFEEFYIWINERKKLNNFYQHVVQLLSDHPNTKLIFIIREEYFAQLSDFETVIPNLLDSRMRVEPINYKQAYDIIDNMTQQANLRFEDQEIIDRIIQSISETDGRINPTFLQLYMKELYAGVE